MAREWRGVFAMQRVGRKVIKSTVAMVRLVGVQEDLRSKFKVFIFDDRCTCKSYWKSVQISEVGNDFPGFGEEMWEAVHKAFSLARKSHIHENMR